MTSLPDRGATIGAKYSSGPALTQSGAAAKKPRMDYAKALGDTFLFKGMPAAELKKLASIAKEEELAGKTELFREGDAGEAMYVIVMGTVRVLKKNEGGESEEVAVLGTSGYVGEIALVTDDHKRTATVVAQEQSRLLVLSRSAIEKLCDGDDKLAHHFYRAVSRGLARRLASTTQDAASYRAMWRTRHHS
jgi:CRP/FNR family transcriptional regulator, cyclic AMP receptor protein